MKKAVLWIGVAAMVLMGALMVFSALTVHQLYPPLQQPVLANDPKLRQMFEEEQRHRERQEYRLEFQYITAAALEFTVAAFVAGKARRS